MNTTRTIRTAFVAGAVACTAALGLTAPAMADSVIAVDETIAAAPVAPAHVPAAIASKPRSITVTNHEGRSVTLFAKGERIRRVLAPGKAPVSFTGLTAGRTYTVAIGGQPIGTVIALDAPSAASGLAVRTTSSPGTVALSWHHTPTTATGGRAIRYNVSASSSTAPTVTTTAQGARTATLTGLRPDAIYSFTVVPTNAAGRGRATSASMSRTLAEVTGTSVAATPVVEVPKPAAPAPTPTVSAQPAPAPAPAPAPRPSSKTIYVCPEGFVTTGELCTLTRAYTYHTETLTSPYTFHDQFTQTGTNAIFSADCSLGGVYYADAGQGPGCYRWQPTGYYTSVKDAPPAGYTDNGTQYVKDVQVKDALPDGFTDDGTQWVKTASKQPMTITI